MTKRVGNVVVVQATVPSKCELCGSIAELRPYGPHGEYICYPCGMKHRESTERAFERLLDGTNNDPVN